MEFIVEKITKNIDITIDKVDDLEDACKVIQDDAFINYPEESGLIDWKELISNVIDMMKMNNEFEIKLISLTYKTSVTYKIKEDYYV